PKAARQPISAVVVGSALVLAAALAASFGFLVVRGGFNVQIASPDPALLAAASPSPAVSPSAQPTASPSPSSSPSPSPSATPSSSPTPVPTPTPAPPARATPTPAPSSNRYALLTRCPSTPNCWIYTVRAGDNLKSIANYFGVPHDTVLRMNPQITDPTAIRAGDKVKLPPPTR
ncbi:MAG TPA: LysM domain-containing protein, partial [Candidatus Limnocylindrales bacterium]